METDFRLINHHPNPSYHDDKYIQKIEKILMLPYWAVMKSNDFFISNYNNFNNPNNL